MLHNKFLNILSFTIYSLVLISIISLYMHLKANFIKAYLLMIGPKSGTELLSELSQIMNFYDIPTAIGRCMKSGIILKPDGKFYA